MTKVKFTSFSLSKLFSLIIYLVLSPSVHNLTAKTISSTPKKYQQSNNVYASKSEALNNDLDTNITIELVEQKDADEVLKLLRESFFKDEPTNHYLNLTECKELEDYSLKLIPEKCSFKAVNSAGKIIGFFLNGIVEKNSSNDDGADKSKDPKFKIILTLIEYVEKQFNVFNAYPDINRYLDGKVLSVDSNYRGHGIAGKLTQRTLEHMQKNNVPLMSVLCTSYYSARVLEKLSFKEAYKLLYKDYIVNGKNPLLPAEPHTAVRLMVKRVL